MTRWKKNTQNQIIADEIVNRVCVAVFPLIGGLLEWLEDWQHLNVMASLRRVSHHYRN